MANLRGSARVTAISALVLSAMLLGAPLAPMRAQAAASPPVATEYSDEDFVTLYPGVYTEREAALVRAYLEANRALRERGPIDIKALIEGRLPKNTPGIGPVVRASEDWVRYNNAKYDPESRLRHDAAYARQLGYKDIVAFVSFAAHDDTFMVPYPTAARDRLLVSHLNHSLTSHRPIHPGDTLYLVMDDRRMRDLTPPGGAKMRSVAIESDGSIYNQRGEKVSSVTFRVVESVRILKDPSRAPKNPGFFDIWEAPDWLRRPAHVYTDADWTRIRNIWAQERMRGAEPLYWDDVTIGEQPAATLDGPVLASVIPVPPWGMGAGGSRTLKREIMDPASRAKLQRGEKDGIYRALDPAVNAPPVPKQSGAATGQGGDGAIVTSDIHKDGEKRSPLVNYVGRDHAIRHLTNWIGDRGWIETINWSIMDPRAHWVNGKAVPRNPNALTFLHRVPFMRDRFVNTHALTQDVMIVRSYVTDKYSRDGRFLADIVWWIETIEGDIVEEGDATVRLPTRAEGADAVTKAVVAGN
ncbi:MAG: MaoC family dehydratase N-terminal domain-containing protein [Sphingomonas sp.]|uniref:hypothetical protein n=1 Tax=Sphingomonas sp. TaxID=28214 RepID=UPI00261E60E4|nr:hypothetical protein [Sphingomonas sp.]MDK2770006.1 MaoC family dehydratase N-terminal domain-containing protein [Sphingomonas sp.]